MTRTPLPFVYSANERRTDCVLGVNTHDLEELVRHMSSEAKSHKRWRLAVKSAAQPTYAALFTYTGHDGKIHTRRYDPRFTPILVECVLLAAAPTGRVAMWHALLLPEYATPANICEAALGSAARPAFDERYTKQRLANGKAVTKRHKAEDLIAREADRVLHSLEAQLELHERRVKAADAGA